MKDSELFEYLECYAKEEGIPIMLLDGINYITDFIKEKNIKSVLEVGTAIAYSALKMASVGARVTTIERDEIREKEAIKNVELSNYKDRITLIFDDAFNTNISQKFDLIFIDAAKGKNKEFIEKFKNNLNDDGYILIDNIDFHGLVGHSSEITSRNLRSLVRKIEGFLRFLETQKDFKVTKINKGDGLILLERIKNE